MKYKINLIDQGENKGGFLNKVNYFFFNYFRYILVLTQLTVITVLFFRFMIDQNIIDLKESIRQQEEVIKAVKPILEETGRIDAKLNKSKLILQDQGDFQKQLNYLIPKFPESIFLTKLSLTKDSTIMEGNILNASHLQSFFNKIKSENMYKEVLLSNIQRNEQGYFFSMKLNSFTEKNGR